MPKNLKLPFTKESIQRLVSQHPTPFYIYDEAGIRANARALYKAFSWAKGFKNYFAVKALPNPNIMKILHEEGMGMDCSSLAELMLCERVNIKAEDVMFTSNQTPLGEYVKAKTLGAVLNLDDITHIDFVEKNIGLPELVSFRYNPGPLKGGNSIIGKPEEAKYGLTEAQILEAFKLVKSKGVKRFGIHTMVASNELNPDYFVETADILFKLSARVCKETGITLDFINLGGGVGIPYKLEQERVDYNYLSEHIKGCYDSALTANGYAPKLFFECGRCITGPYGWLITTAIHEKHIYKEYIGADACAANLMRPAMYGAYHHIVVLGKENAPANNTYDVVGGLCENSDKFAIDRKLPKIELGDLLAIYDTGAHGHAMGYNYNGKTRSAELLLRPDGSAVQIRRAETQDDLFATIKFNAI
ncbi:diaminopimelate decarboxylase [Deferribacterales bacterium RsTz2092]|nr:diaminopimelate decarboxylase [Deferribacterales bacterium]